jgi:photosystem II cytochrome c550
MSQIFKGELRMKRFILLAVATIFFAFQTAVGSVAAVELSTDVRTIKANEAGDTTVLSLEEVQKGKRLFNDTCSQCHGGGRTKTDPNIGLGTDVLAGATPPRDNISALVDYMKNPTTYDGEIEISELHPSLKSADIYPEMRNLTDEDLEAIAGHILLQPKILGRMWGGGKVYN